LLSSHASVFAKVTAEATGNLPLPTSANAPTPRRANPLSPFATTLSVSTPALTLFLLSMFII
jgi:hypothetical protein